MQPIVSMQPNGVGTVNFGQPDQVNVNFYAKQVPDKQTTQQTGIPQFKTIDYVRIQHPGERDYTDYPVSDRPVITDMYPRQWAAFQQSKQYVPDGTPIEMLFPQASEMAIAGTLRGLGIHTVQQLANLTVEGMQRIGMGAQDYVTHAKKYLDTASGGAGYHKLQRDIAERDNKIEVLENNMRLMRSQIEQLIAQQQGAAQHTLLSSHAQASIAAQAAGTMLPGMVGLTQASPPTGSVLPPPMWTRPPTEIQPPPDEPAPKRRGRPPNPTTPDKE